MFPGGFRVGSQLRRMPLSFSTKDWSFSSSTKHWPAEQCFVGAVSVSLCKYSFGHCTDLHSALTTAFASFW